jgi:hypothetical protein
MLQVIPLSQVSQSIPFPSEDKFLFDGIQGTFGGIQGTFGGIQGTFTSCQSVYPSPAAG